jgi:DMSO/TMAO reductase YedYZ heme-binding membrane subunit
MIQCTVRVCVPFLFLAFVSSSMTKLAPAPLRKWLMRNRRHFGLAFTVGFAWQMLYILWLFFGHPEYYSENVYGGVESFLQYRFIPYLFLTAMTITSFHPVRRKMNRKLWSVLHWVGIYYLWYVVWITYWYEVTAYDDRQIIDYIYVVLGALAYLARVGEWIRVREWRRIGARMLRAAKLDAHLHQDVRADRGTPRDSNTIIVLSAVAVGIGNLVYLGGGFDEIIGETAGGLHLVARDAVRVLFGWSLWVYFIYMIGTRLLPETDTQIGFGDFLRSVGFSCAPGLIALFAIIPILTPFAFAISGAWVLCAMAIATRQALNYQSTGRAVSVCLIGSAAQLLIVVGAASVLGTY